jgi:hypothetical protein
MLVNQAGSQMDEIVAAVKRVTDITAEITAASAEQSSGIDQVNTAVSQMDRMTQQNAALVEQAAAAAESLREEAARLLESVSVFKLAGGRMTSSSRTGEPPIGDDSEELHSFAEQEGPDPRRGGFSQRPRGDRHLEAA